MALISCHKRWLMDVYSGLIRVTSNWLVSVLSLQVSTIMSSRLEHEMTILILHLI